MLEEPPHPRPSLSESDFHPDPIEQFRAWFLDATSRQVPEPHRMTLATATREGAPSARIVLLRGVDSRGLVFFTHYRSRKGREIESNPRVALVFHWPEVHRQVRIEGAAERVAEEESDRYFARRPVGSRLGAIVSPQSQVIGGRAELRERVLDLVRRLRRDRQRLARPELWGGYRVRPVSMEFWQAGRNRLHDRLRYRRDEAGAWRIERLAP